MRTLKRQVSIWGNCGFQRHVLFHRWSLTLSKPLSYRWRRRDSRWRWDNTFLSSAPRCPGWSGTLSHWPPPLRKTSLASIFGSLGTGRKDFSMRVAVISRSFRMLGNYLSKCGAHIYRSVRVQEKCRQIAPLSHLSLHCLLGLSEHTSSTNIGSYLGACHFMYVVRSGIYL